MEKPENSRLLRKYFPGLQNQDLLERISEAAQWIRFDTDTTILDVGDSIREIPMVIRGVVKVFRDDPGGNSVFLYYIREGQSCAFTLNSCLQHEKSTVRAIAAAGTELLALPGQLAYNLNRDFPLWQDFVLATYSGRFRELINVIDSVCFEQMDARLIRYLTTHRELTGSNIIRVSHQQIANDLNSSREVISRLLKQLESKEKVSLHRGRIRLLNV